ncbi:hypothetical protein FGO68_gene15983 [Halteria grandinella]|uniref:Ankyrin repeat domain-containing protein n=1 Tax=Halteria grandinella TaxID=5974 RepID=A0A8J8NMY2_HALGN|nr:hypothetical protein FGO68_gene15983 [Halteria grandinella]
MLSTNQKNCFVLVVLIASIIFNDSLHQYLAGSLFGMIVSYLFFQVRQFGLKQAFYSKNDPRTINQIVTMAADGRLTELQKVYEVMPKDQFLSIKQQGGQTLLIFATHFAHLDVMQWLISIGADVNELSNQKESPLLRACHFNRYEAAKLLIQHKANLNQVSQDGTTPLARATLRNKPELVKLLLENGALIDKGTLIELRKPGELLDGIRNIVTEELVWRRKREMLKWHKQNSGTAGNGYPEAARRINKNVLNKVLAEYI